MIYAERLWCQVGGRTLASKIEYTLLGELTGGITTEDALDAMKKGAMFGGIYAAAPFVLTSLIGMASAGVKVTGGLLYGAYKTHTLSTQFHRVKALMSRGDQRHSAVAAVSAFVALSGGIGGILINRALSEIINQAKKKELNNSRLAWLRAIKTGMDTGYSASFFGSIYNGVEKFIDSKPEDGDSNNPRDFSEPQNTVNDKQDPGFRSNPSDPSSAATTSLVMGDLRRETSNGETFKFETLLRYISNVEKVAMVGRMEQIFSELKRLGFTVEHTSEGQVIIKSPEYTQKLYVSGDNPGYPRGENYEGKASNASKGVVQYNARWREFLTEGIAQFGTLWRLGEDKFLDPFDKDAGYYEHPRYGLASGICWIPSLLGWSHDDINERLHQAGLPPLVLFRDGSEINNNQPHTPSKYSQLGQGFLTYSRDGGKTPDPGYTIHWRMGKVEVEYVFGFNPDFLKKLDPFGKYEESVSQPIVFVEINDKDRTTMSTQIVITLQSNTDALLPDSPFPQPKVIVASPVNIVEEVTKAIPDPVLLTYTVEGGDYLALIAQKLGVNMGDLEIYREGKWIPVFTLDNLNMIRPGEQIRVRS